MRYEIPGANPENLVSADNFAFFMDLLSVICYLLSVVSYQTSDILKVSY